ncbi:uncharacterized protein G2W53_010302 [Senna tora]|uniref:Uncharacterized protein n=1 Tax=Senna tora TaxID=362788 RepID=A0A834WZT8_9FABA|nr:uncharacterized protein G2W53_010302 [Senna tora]
MLRHDPRSSNAMKTPIGASKPHRFANTTRTDVFHTLTQQVFCIVIREGFWDPTRISPPKYVKARSTLLPCHDNSNWSIKSTQFVNTTRTNVFHSLAQQVFCRVIREGF